MVEPEHANTFSQYPEFILDSLFDSVNVDADQPRLDQISVFPGSGELPSAAQTEAC